MEDHIRAYDHAISVQLCQEIIDLFCRDTENQVDGYTLRATSGLQTNQDLRLAKDLFIHSGMQHLEWWREIDSLLFDHFTKVLHQYITDFEILSDSQVKDSGYCIRYYPKDYGHYGWHADAHAKYTESRAVSGIAYLNDVQRGGETEFSDFPRIIRPQAGTIVLFPSGWTHRHRGNRPQSNDKYIVTTFFTVVT